MARKRGAVAHSRADKDPHFTKFTEQTRKTIVEGIRQGLHPTTACAKAGISKTTFDRWLRNGRATNSRPSDICYFNFAQNVMQAEAEAQSTLLDAIQNIAAEKGDWKGFAWLLERLNRQVYGAKTEVSGTIEVVAPEVIERMAAMVAEVVSEEADEETAARILDRLGERSQALIDGGE
jgi:hypothetical protein